MIVLHPSSTCDVCLDTYTWDTPANTPHAIACGHIFCLVCLRNLSPASCPLCRKAFQPDRIKKLHLDRPSDESTVIDSEAFDFLQRLALVSGEESPEAHVADVIEEVDHWLSRQSDDTHRPLRSAVAALRKYKALQDRNKREREEYRNRRREFESFRHSVEQDQRAAKAVEENLLAKLQDVEQEYARKFSAADAEVASLRSEMSRFRNPANPLPPPPEPLPADRFPPFARLAGTQYSTGATGNRNVAISNINSHRSAITPSHGPSSVDRSTSNDRNSNSLVGPELRPLTREEQQALERTHERSLRDVDHATRAEGRQTPVAGPSTAPMPPPSQFRPPIERPYATDDIFHHHLADSNGHTGYRADIKPGAPPAQRVVPPVPQYKNDDKRGWPASGSGSRAQPDYGQDRDRMEGTSEMGRNGLSYWDQTRDMDRSYASLSRGPGDGSMREADSDSRFASASAFVSGYASGLGQGYAHASGYFPEDESDYDGDSSSDDSPQARERGIGSLGLIGVPEAPLVTSVVPPGVISVPPRATDIPSENRPAPRRNATAPTHTQARTSATESMSELSLYALPAPDSFPRRLSQSLMQAVPTGGEGNGRPISMSSWGTVRTGDVIRDGRGSMSDLDLVGFPPAEPGSETPSAEETDDQEDLESRYATPIMNPERSMNLPGLTPQPGQGSALGLMTSGAAGVSENLNADRHPWAQTDVADDRPHRLQPASVINSHHQERLSHRQPLTTVGDLGSDWPSQYPRSTSQPLGLPYQQTRSDGGQQHRLQQPDRVESRATNRTHESDRYRLHRDQRPRSSSTTFQSATIVPPAPYPHSDRTYAPEMRYNPSSYMPSWGVTTPYPRAHTASVGPSSHQQVIPVPHPGRVDNTRTRAPAPIMSSRNTFGPWSSRH